MGWQKINSSDVEEWSERVGLGVPSYAESSVIKSGVPIEEIVALTNATNTDIWVCVPHKASDDYIDTFAAYLRDNVEAGRTIIIEYSNEVWNSGFDQRGYVEDNAPSHPNGYVSTALAAIGAAGTKVQEKYAWMCDRVFDRFYTVFSGQTNRLKKVVAWQAAGGSQSQTILTYLYDTLGNTADALAIAAVFIPLIYRFALFTFLLQANMELRPGTATSTI